MSVKASPYILIASGTPSTPVLNIIVPNDSAHVATNAQAIALMLAKAGYYNFDLFVDEGNESYFNLGRVEVAVQTNASFKPSK